MAYVPRVLNVYKYTFTAKDNGITSDVSVTSSDYTTIWRKTVSDNEGYKIGRTDGYFYIAIKDTSGNTVHGTVRIVIVSPDNSIRKVLYELNTRLCGDATDIFKKPKLPPLHRGLITKNWKIELELKAEASATVDVSELVLLMDGWKAVLG